LSKRRTREAPFREHVEFTKLTPGEQVQRTSHQKNVLVQGIKCQLLPQTNVGDKIKTSHRKHRTPLGQLSQTPDHAPPFTAKSHCALNASTT